MRSYLKSQKLQYNVPRRSFLKGKLKAKMVKGSWRGIQPRREASAVAVNVADITQFLAKYLSGKPDVAIRPIPEAAGFATTVEWTKPPAARPVHTITLPAWDAFDLPFKGFDRYRIYRSGVWHEANHVRHTPLPLYKWQSSAEQTFFNIIEDRRIEDLGVEDWPGYLPERIYTQAYAYSLRPEVDKINDRHQAVTEAFMQRLLIGKYKGSLPKDEAEKVEEAARNVEEQLKKLKGADEQTLTKRLRELTQETIAKLQIPPDASTPTYGSESPWTDTFNPDYPYRQGKSSRDVEEGMEEFFKDLERQAKAEPTGKDGEKKTPHEITRDDVKAAKEGSADAKNEYERAQKKTPLPEPEIAKFLPVLSQGATPLYRDQKFITAMNTHLRKWKTGFKEIVGEKGARLSIPQYIRHKEEPFATRIKMSARGKKMLVVADFSGSMHDKEDEYKRALVSAMEVLGGIGSNIAFFGFGTDPAQGNVFFRVKGFTEPKWTQGHSAKVASIEAKYPSTPTPKIYELLEPYIKKHRPAVTVTVTDGEPDNPAATTELVKKLRRHTRMVAFGIADPKTKEHMAKRLRNLEYNRSFVVTDVYEIPPRLVKLIAPE